VCLCVRVRSVGHGDGRGARARRAIARPMERAIAASREDARAHALAASRGDARACVSACVSATERLAIGACAGRAARGRRRRGDGDAGGRARGDRDGAREGVRARGDASASASRSSDEDDDDDDDDEDDDDDDERERILADVCAWVKRARAEIGLDAFRFESAAGAREAAAEALSEDDLDDALAQVEYASDGWETAPDDRSQRASAGGSRAKQSCAVVSDVFSQLAGGRGGGGDEDEEVDAGARADEDGRVTDGEEDFAGGTQAFEDFDDDDEPVVGTQALEDIEADFIGGTQVVESPMKRASPIGLKLSASPLTLPRTKKSSERASEAPSIPAAPTSLWAVASNTPPEERARRERVGHTRGLVDRASVPRANADTQPTMGVEDADEGDDDNARENDGPTLLSTFNDSKRVDCTPIDAMTEQPSKPPTLKRPGAMRAPTHEHSSMVTASARPLGSIGSEHGEVMGVARTAIEAVKRARAKMNEPLGLDMSMPQCDDDSQLVDDDADDVVEATPMAAEGEDDALVGDGPESAPSSPDIGILYSQRPMNDDDEDVADVASPQRPHTQHSQSPFKRQLIHSLAPPMSQPEVESPRSRIMLSQHQWRQPRRRAPPPPRFDEETPSKRYKIIDDDLSQSMTQGTQDEPASQGEFVDCSQRENEGGLIRPRISSLPAPTVVNRTTAASGCRIVAPSPSEKTPSKDEIERPLPPLGCPKCRHAVKGCGRCRTIRENAKNGIWPSGRGRSKKSSVDSASAASASKSSARRATHSASKTPASKTPMSKTPMSKRTKTAAGKENKPNKRSSAKMFASLHFLLSGLGKVGTATKDIIKAHGGTVLSEPSSDISVNSVIVVTPTMGRTMKCLYGIAAGARFATPAWVEACADEGRMIQIDEPLDAEGNPREHHRACLGKLFRDVKAAITGNEGFVKDFTSLLSHAGATLERNPQTDDRFDYLITQSGENPHSAWIRASKRLGVPCVRHEWLVDSILAGELLDVAAYATLASPPNARASIPPHFSLSDASQERANLRRKSTRY